MSTPTISKQKLPFNVTKMQEQYLALEAEYAALKELYVKLEAKNARSDWSPSTKSQVVIENNKDSNAKGITVTKIQ